MSCVIEHLSVMWTMPQTVLLCRHWWWWEQSAQDVAWIVVDSCKQPLITFLHQLNKVWQIWRAVSTSLAAAKECFDALVVCAGDKSNPCWRCVCQPRHNDRPENCLQTSFTEAMMPQHSQCVQRLRTVADDATDVVRRRQRVGERDAEHFQRCAACDIGQRLDAVSTSVVVEHDFPCLAHVQP